MKDIKITEKAKAWADKEYDDLRYSKCEKKHFVFTFRELREMGKEAYIAGYEAALESAWRYPKYGDYPENRKLDNLHDYNPLVLVFMYRYDDHGKAARVYALDRWEPENKRWQNNRHDTIEGWQYLPEFKGE